MINTIARVRRLAGRLKAAIRAPAPLPPPEPGFHLRLAQGFGTPPRPVESEVEPAVLAALFARTQAQWRKLGETDPHWSVLTHDSYRAGRIDAAARAEFYETGRGNADLVELMEQRTGLSLGRGVCLELGCGVGRITRHLAAKFERVIAVDISPGNLALAGEYLAEEGVTNVDLVLMEDIAEIESLPAFDVLFSLIALQHNSPPVQDHILDRLLAKIRPGGGALFQAVTNLPGYGFVAADYLAGGDEVMEIHALPQVRVSGLLRRHGLDLHEVAMDAWLDAYGSNTFFATRRPN